MPIDPVKLDGFMNQVFADLGATFHATLIVIGDKLGLYRALAEVGPQTPKQLAQRSNTAERYIREWLPNTTPPQASIRLTKSRPSLLRTSPVLPLIPEDFRLRWPPLVRRKSCSMHSERARASDGMTTMKISSPAPNGSSGRTRRRTSSRNGFQR